METITSYCEFATRRLNLMIEMAASRSTQDLMVIHLAMEFIKKHRWPDSVVASFPITQDIRDFMEYFVGVTNVASFKVYLLKIEKEGPPGQKKITLNYDPATEMLIIENIGLKVCLLDYSGKQYIDRVFKTFKEVTKLA